MTRSTLLLAALCAALLAGAAPASAALRAPALQTPANEASGHTVPVWTWGAVKSADMYEVAISADKRFGSLVTGSTVKTRNTAATLSKSLPDGRYYWRTRAISKAGKAGRWSTVREYDKVWQDAPDLLAPANEISVQWPGAPLTMRWSAVPRATRYLVTVATDPSLAQPVFKPVETHATVYAVPGALAAGRYYWAVQPIDEAGFKGRPSRVGAFTWSWPSQTQVSIDDVDPRDEVIEPFVRWAQVPGAAKYQVEINPTAEFAPGSKVFDELTVATSVSPRDPLPNNTYYVRVRAIDPNNNAGPWSTAVTQKRFTPAVTGLRVGDNASESVAAGTPNSKPVVAWDPVAGAAGYTLQFGAWNGVSCNWSQTLTTYNAAWSPTHRTPGSAQDPGWRPRMTTQSNPFVDGTTYCVRVRPFQSDQTYGAWTERKPALTYEGQPVLADVPCGAPIGTPGGTYRSPVHTVSPRTPVFRWNEISGARGYWLVVAKDADFTTIVETAWTDTPVFASSRLTYSDETTSYFWAVVPSSSKSGGCISTHPSFHDPQTFHKRSTPPSLMSPDVGGEVWSQPTFRWSVAESANTYRLEVDTDPSFASPIETVTTASTTFTTSRSYPVDSVLYWRVRAVDARGVQLNWSSTGTFRRRLPTPGERANPAGGEVIPVLSWAPVDGAVAYDFHVDQADGTSKDFTVVSPAFSPTLWYGTGVWRWKVRARFPSLSGSAVTGPYGPEQSYVRRLNPPGRPRIVYTKSRLYFTWDADPAAAQYRLEVSRTDSFTRTVDSVKTPQTSYAPLLNSRDYTNGGKLYWRLANVDQGGNVGAFAMGTFKLPKALVVKAKKPRVPRGKRSSVLITVSDVDRKRIGKATVALSGAGIKRITKRSGKKGTVTFRVRPRKKGTIVLRATRAGYREGELRLTVR